MALDAAIITEVNVLVDPNDATVDIVAIPGLGANPIKSWMGDEKDEKSFNWLKDKEGLQKDFPKARIMLYHYASAYRGDFKIRQYMSNIADTMLVSLKQRREEPHECPRRPIVLIGHSMGGLVAAKVLTLAEQRREKFPSMYESIVGVLTFGTPFDGAPVADIAAQWTKLQEPMGKAVTSKLLDLLTPGNESLRELKRDFVRSAIKLGQKVDIHCFYEQKETRWDAIIEKLAPTDFPMATLDKLKLKEYREFVCRESATLSGASETGLARTHRDLVRFGNCKDSQYQLVRASLKRIVHPAARNAKARFNYMRQFSIDPKTLKSVIDALDGADMQRKLKSLSQRLAPDSWILKEPEFKDWLEDKSKVDDFLWIYGAEGKGKTPAVTAVIKNIESTINKNEIESSDRSPTLLAYFFCDQNPDYCTAEDVVKSLLRQLCLQQESLANYAKQFIPKAAAGGSSTKGDSGSGNSSALGIENLCQCLRDMFTESSIDTVYFIICNLHELPEEEDSTKKLLSFLQSVVDSPQSETGKRVRTKWLFATRDRIAIRRALGSNEAVRKIDLNDSEKYGDKVKLELQRHAWSKVDSLREQKGYNKAIAYFAGSVIGSRAESTKWIDVAIVQLAALPAQSNDIKVRKMLERVPQDFATLLDHAWRSILSTNEEGLDTIKELLRALVLTYEDPTENELLVLAGLPSDDAKHKEELRKTIQKCRPLLTLRKSGDEVHIGFVNADVKKHLHRNSNKLLDLHEDAVQLQHGILALRCFSHIVDTLTTVLQSRGRPESPTFSQGQQHRVAAPEAVTAPVSRASIAGGGSDDSDSEDMEFDFDDDDSSDSDSDYSSVQELEAAEPVPILPYATRYWLQHASQATLDIAERLSLEKAFWESDSEIRHMWLREYERLTSAFDDLKIDKHLKALHVAASVGFPRLVESLLKAGYDNEVNEYDSLENTPLHLAASFGKAEIVEQLLEIKSVKLDDAGKDGTACTPLSMAALSGKIAVMKKLISKGANVDTIDAESGPVINSAILSGNSDAVTLLIEKNAKLNYPMHEHEDAEWDPPLALSALSSDLPMFKTILEAGKEVLSQEEYGKALILASESGRIEVVSLLLEHQHSQEIFQESLEAALEEDNWDVIKLLLRRSDSRLDCTDVFTEASTGAESLDDVLEEIWKHTQGCIDQKLLNDCLYTATDNEKESTVRVLLGMGANPDAEGELYGNALTAAANDGVTADDGTVPIVQALLDAGATVTSDSGWALQIAAEQGHLAVVKLLLKRGADINHFSETHPSGTALQAACDCGHEDIVAFLVSKGADPNVGGGINEYPIIAASMNSDILPCLLTAPGIELNVIGGPDRANPLIYAARSLPVESMEQLIHAGADVDMADEVGDTPLIAAADSGDSECVKLLLKHGADIMVVSPDRDTALEVALEEGDDECIELLASRAADILKRLQTSAQSGSKLARRIIKQERESRDYEHDEQDTRASTGSQEPDENQDSELEDHLARLNLDDDSHDDNADDRDEDDDDANDDDDDRHDEEGDDETFSDQYSD